MCVFVCVDASETIQKRRLKNGWPGKLDLSYPALPFSGLIIEA